MIYHASEEQIKSAYKKAAAYRAAASYLPAIRPVFQAFDGKVLNCRFSQALHDATGHHFSVEKSFDGKIVFIYYYDCGHTFTIAKMPTEKMKDNKRINAEVLLESAREYREQHLRRAYEIEKAAEGINLTLSQIEDMKNQLNSIIDHLPAEIKDICRIQRVY